MDLIQNSFAGGEISPKLEGRTDIQRYAISNKTVRNMICHVAGPISNRPGTRYAGPTKTSATKSRLLPFKYGSSQYYAMEFGNQYIRFWSDGAQITVDDTLLSNFAQGLSYAVDWHVLVGNYVSFTFTGSKKLAIFAPYGLTNSNTIKIATQANTADTLAVIAAGDTITVKFANATASKNTGTLIRNAIRALGTVNGVDISGILACTNNAYASAPVITGTNAAALLGSGNKIYKCIQASPFTTGNYFPPVETAYWREFTSGDPLEITSAYNIFNLDYIKIAQSGDTVFIACPGRYPRILTRYEGYNWTLSLFNFKNGPFMPSNITSVTITPSATTGSITLTASSGMFYSGHVSSFWRISTGIVQITAVTDTLTATATVISTLPGTSAYADWAEGSWSNYRGWPECVAFYGDRIEFASTLAEPQTKWSSKLGDYTNFGVSSPLVATDSITQSLSSREQHKIQSISNLGDMMVLTDEGAWYSGPPPGSDGSYTPSSNAALFKVEGGSSYVSPVIINNQAVYIHASGTELCFIEYDQAGNFTGGSLTIFSDHLFENHSFTELAYQRKPEPICWALRDDGIMIGITISRVQQVYAAHRHDTYGIIESMCTLPGDKEDEFWIIVNRDGNRYVERFAPRTGIDDISDAFFVDCGLSLNVPITITGITSANPPVITAAAHGLTNGDKVDFSDIIWNPTVDRFKNEVQPDQLNRRQYMVANATTNTFTVQDEDGVDIDGSSWRAYVSGGVARKAVTTVSGLDHLEGKTVAILANGSPLDEQVVTSGTVTLETPASRIHVGLPYVSDWESLNLEVQTQSGTSQTKKMEVPAASIRVNKSRGGFMGQNKETLTEITYPNPKTGMTPLLISDDIPVVIGSGMKLKQRLFFRQIDPLPVTIVAVMPKVNIGG